MSAQVLSATAGVNTGTVTLPSVALAAGDVIIATHTSTAGTPTAASGMSGCGATWSLAWSTSTHAATVWVGVNPTSVGSVTKTGGSTFGGQMSAFVVRGVSPAATGYITGPTGPAVTLDPAQAVVGRNGNTSSLGVAAESLPSPSTWAVSGTRFHADGPASDPAVYQFIASGTTSNFLLTVVVGTAPPGVPTDLQQTAATPYTIDAAWTAPTSGATPTGYEYRLDGGPATLVDVTAIAVADLAPGVTYVLEVRTVSATGVSAWVALPVTTLDEPSGGYRAVVRLGDHTWDVSAGDPPILGPVLPVSFGWAVPDDALGFPAQPDPELCSLELVTADWADLAGVDIATPMRVSLYASPAPTARPLATFRGRVGDMEAAPHPMGLAWRVLGVGYTADPASRPVNAGGWPQESGDARAARIMAEAGYPGWAAPPIGTTFEARAAAPGYSARAALADLSDEAVTTEGTAYGPSRRVLVHPVTDDNGDLTPAAPFQGAAVLRRVDALDVVSAGLVNRATSWRRTKLLDATWVRIDHPGGPTTYGDTRGPAYPPQSVTVLDPRELADLILDTTPGYRWLTGVPLRLELWADDGPALAVVSRWFYRDPDSDPFPWSGRAVLVRPVANSPDGSDTYAGMLTAATMRLEASPTGGRLVVEFRLRPDIPAHSTVTMRWMDEPPAATWADELAADPTGTWYDYYTTPRP